jgi:hypothetical protein
MNNKAKRLSANLRMGELCNPSIQLCVCLSPVEIRPGPDDAGGQGRDEMILEPFNYIASIGGLQMESKGRWHRLTHNRYGVGSEFL